jgi:lysozyme
MKLALIISVVVLLGMTFEIARLEAAEKAKFRSGKEMTKYFEGFRDRAYYDSRGILTIGYGFNFIKFSDSSRRKYRFFGMTVEEADEIFENMYRTARQEAYDWVGPNAYWKMNDTQRDILTDMAYNMGAKKLATFVRMRECLLRGDFKCAAKEMEDSAWYKQVGRRGRHHVKMFTQSQS